VRGALYERYGGPEVLEVRDLEPPRPEDDEVLVRVRAAAVNPVDWKIRRGSLRPFASARFPMIPGSDLAGEVLETGSAVTRFQPGDAIYAMLQPAVGGACAERAVVPADAAGGKPDNLSFEEAAAVPLAALTALQALRDKGRIAPGMRVLVNGGSGGVGSFAIQIAKRMETEVTAVASGRNLDLLRALGADRAIDYQREDFTRRQQVWDVVLDTVSTHPFREVAHVLSPEGRYIHLQPTPGGFLLVLATRLAGLFGFRKRAETLLVQPRGPELEELKEWIGEGHLRPVLHGVYPLNEIARAHTESESGHARGKIVLSLAG